VEEGTFLADLYSARQVERGQGVTEPPEEEDEEREVEG